MDDEIMRYRDKLIRQAQNLPIWERKCLTVDEAAEYSGIGRKKLRSLLKKKNCPFALSDGFQLLIIREKLDEYCKCYSNLNHTSAAHTTPPVTGVLPLCTRLRRVRRNNPPWRSL